MDKLLRRLPQKARRLFVYMEDHGLQPEACVEQDGGPGSGNWGHKGRPGKRGGSGKGGGKQYRGGRGDIMYASSRKDWLNGLSGENQKKAKEFMEYWDARKLDRNKSTEQSIMELQGAVGERVRTEYLDYLSKARCWEQNAKALTDENWSNADRQLATALANKYSISTLSQAGLTLPSEYDMDTWAKEDVKCWQDLKSKAMDGPTSGEEAPDELQYEAGLKERPAKSDFSWYQPSSFNSMIGCMNSVIGGAHSYGHRYSKEEFIDINQKFVDMMKYGNPAPNDCSYYAMEAIGDMRKQIANPGPNNFMDKEFRYTKDVFDRLDKAEKDQLLNIMNTFSNSFAGYDDVYALTEKDFKAVERRMRQMTPRKNTEKQPFKDYVLLQEKMLLGVEPTNSADMQQKQAEAEAANAKAAQERREKAIQVAPDHARAIESAKDALRNNGMLGIINQAQTTDEVERAMRTNGMFKSGSQAKLGGMDIDTAKSVATMYNDMLQKFPFMVGHLGAPSSSYHSKNAFAGSALNTDGTIMFNPMNYGNAADAQASFEKSVATGFHPAGLDYRSVPYHEFGHSLDGWLSKQLKDTVEAVDGSIYLRDSVKNSVSYDLCLAVKKALKIGGSVDDFRGLTSTYCQTDHCTKNDEYKEWFAETFSEAYCSKNPRPPAVELRKQLEALIKKNGWEGPLS